MKHIEKGEKMDYQKMSEQTLDKVMQQIRVANGMFENAQPQKPEVRPTSVAQANSVVDTSEGYLQMIESNLANAAIGKQIGLHKSPMHKKRGLVKKLARVVERVYLRIAEFTSRDIRDFSESILAALNKFKSQVAQLLGNDQALASQLNQLQGELAIVQESFLELQAKQQTAEEVLEQGFEVLHADDAQIKEQLQKACTGEIEQLQASMGEISEDIIRLHENFKAEVVQEFEGRTATLVEKHNQNLLEVRRLTEQLSGVKAIVKWANNEQFTETVAAKSIHSTLDNPVFYHDFEEKFRGTQEDIRQRLRVYLPMLSSHFGIIAEKSFLDIGCGRGEWLDILKENDVKDCMGLDLNEIQLEICRYKGHRVVHADCLQYIQQLPDESLDVISGMQIIEHLPLDILLALFVECKRVLRTNGIVLFETPNSSNLITAATWFYTDPTHTKPIHKEVARFFVENTGFKNVQIIEVNPVIYSPTLAKPTCFDGNQDVWNVNVDLLNGLLYGAQDYAVLGVKL